MRGTHRVVSSDLDRHPGVGFHHPHGVRRFVEAGPGVSHAEAFAGSGSAEQAGGVDPTGQSGGTMISNMIPSVV